MWSSGFSTACVTVFTPCSQSILSLDSSSSSDLELVQQVIAFPVNQDIHKRKLRWIKLQASAYLGTAWNKRTTGCNLQKGDQTSQLKETFLNPIIPRDVKQVPEIQRVEMA